jgi:hypothetical protein
VGQQVEATTIVVPQEETRTASAQPSIKITLRREVEIVGTGHRFKT